LQALNIRYPEIVSRVAGSVEDAVCAVSGILSNKEHQEPVDLLLLQEITNSDQGFNSSQMILDALDRIAINTDREVQVSGSGLACARKLIPEAKAFVLAVALLIPWLRSLVPERHRHLSLRKPYKHRKVYQLSSAGLTRRMALINEITGLSDQPFSVERLSGNLFKISAKPN
jgi:hypothetical protein